MASQKIGIRSISRFSKVPKILALLYMSCILRILYQGSVMKPQGTPGLPQSGNGLKWLRVNDLKTKLGMSKSTIYRMIETQQFPKPYKTPGGGLSVWIESEVEEWMRAATQNQKGQ